MKTSEVVEQSKNAYGQWAPVWRKNAEYHKKHAPFKKMNDFLNVGIGRACVAVANGYSLEENIETLKKYKDNVDIFCCDKSLGHILNNGIVPTYVLVCDAHVSYEKYLEPWKDQVKDCVLFMNICGNTKWSDGAEWKDILFFINKDVISSEMEFSKISGCTNFVAAATNVSNELVVILTQSSNLGYNNFFGYDKIILLGYDYSWSMDGNYYAFDEMGNGKACYMKHLSMFDRGGRIAWTSNNLIFSSRWLDGYIANFGLPVVLGSDRSMLSSAKIVDLEKSLQYNYKREDRAEVKRLMDQSQALANELHKLNNQLKLIGRDHFISHLRTS